MKYLFYLIGIILFIQLSSCKLFSGNKSNISEDILLAQVYDQTLYLSQIKDKFIDKKLAKKDSISILQNNVDKWIKHTLLIKDAEKKVKNTSEIQKLVQEYRMSLILNHYQKLLIDLQMDTIVSATEILNYYNQHLDDFIISEKHYSFTLIEFPRSIKIDSKFKDWWKDKRDFSNQKIIDFIHKNATFSVILEPDWKTKSDLLFLLPKKPLGKIDIFDSKSHNFKTTSKRYYVKINKELKVNDTSPLILVKDRIKNAILRKRRSLILFTKEKELLQREKNKSNIKLYI